MRPHYDVFGLLLVCFVTAGCAATADKRVAVRPFWKSPAAFAKEQDAAKKTEAAKDGETEIAAKSKNPFRIAAAADNSATTAKNESQSGSPTAKTNGDGTSGSAKDGTKVETASATSDGASKHADQKTAGVFGPETLRLIDAELLDATPEERAFWYDQLKKVDPAVIPQILQARRLTTQVAEHQQTNLTRNDVHSDSRAARIGNAGAATNPFTAVGRQFPGERDDLREANYETDDRAMKSPVVQQNDDMSPAPTGKRPFAVTKIADAGPSNQTVNTPAGASSRNPLSRFLPMGQSIAVTQAAGNNPSGVSLLPPPGTDPRDFRGQLSELISLAGTEVAQLQPGATEAEQADYIQHHVYLRLLYLMADHPERALTAIPGIDSADQEFWQQMLWAMANYFDAEHLPAAKDRAGQAVAQLTTAAQRLREKADLEVRNMAFCREIVYFGNFVRFPRDEFRPGDSALLYAEIENFKSEMTIDGQYRTLIRSTVEILSPSGEVRWHKEFEAKEDLCINYRRDYFHNYQFTIPERLPLGPHTLKLTVFDELSGKMVSQSINFVVR